jgi:hypothetical protein
VGFLAWVGALAALSRKFGYVLPYTYSMLNYLKGMPTGHAVVPAFDVGWLVGGYFVSFVVMGYGLCVVRAQKG